MAVSCQSCWDFRIIFWEIGISKTETREAGVKKMKILAKADNFYYQNVPYDPIKI